MDDEVKRNGWLPDLIVYSPLTRAKQTGEAFAKRHPEVPVVVRDGIVEMAFGDWDNVRVCCTGLLYTGLLYTGMLSK